MNNQPHRVLQASSKWSALDLTDRREPLLLYLGLLLNVSDFSSPYFLYLQMLQSSSHGAHYSWSLTWGSLLTSSRTVGKWQFSTRVSRVMQGEAETRKEDGLRDVQGHLRMSHSVGLCCSWNQLPPHNPVQAPCHQATLCLVCPPSLSTLITCMNKWMHDCINKWA